MANYINEDSVILTEEDAEEFMSEYYLAEGYIVLEGQQAEEYLKRKQEDNLNKYLKDNHDDVDKYAPDKYGTDGKKGRRAQFDFDVYKKGTAYKQYSADRNPRFNTAREIENHRREYGDVMPKSKSKSEKELDKAREKDDNANKYAEKVISSKKSLNNGDIHNLNRAADAARRHYRRTHKNEASIFEQIEFI